MGMRALESAVLAALREAEKNRSIRLKDIAWQLGDTIRSDWVREGDKVIHLTVYGDQKVTVVYTPKAKV